MAERRKKYGPTEVGKALQRLYRGKGTPEDKALVEEFKEKRAFRERRLTLVNCSTCGVEVPVGAYVYEAVKSTVEADGIVRSSDPEDSVVLCEDCFALAMEDEGEE